MLLITTIIGLQGPAIAVGSQFQSIEIRDVVKPNQVSQASSGQVSALIYNSLNQSLEGFGRFTDVQGDITSFDPENPLSPFVNFTIGPYQELNITIDYSVTDDATVGPHLTTFEVSVGGFSFLFDQYQLEVIPVAAIVSLTAGHVFYQGSSGIILTTIENRGNHIQTVRLDLYGPNFTNSSQDVELSPGSNTVAVPIVHNVSHIYDFGVFPVNLSLYYLDELIDSEVTLVPVDMTLINKVLAIILPVLIFQALVIFYTYRKSRRIRAVSEAD